jgi:nucleoside diphosphate kinase
MEIDKLRKDILDSINSGKKATLVKEFDKPDRENETLFFLKPEFFQLKDTSYIDTLLGFVLEKIKEYNLDISGVLTLKGDFLREKKIIERHYGVINKLSVRGSRILKKNDKEKIKAILSIEDLDEYRILGGHELIERFKDITEDKLTNLWYTENGYRIGEGFYIQLHNIAGEKIILINGFNPSQIKHYTSKNSQIVLFLLESDTDWFRIRNNFVGDTFPEKAVEGSIRAILYRNADKYGIESIDVAKNFVHASSGPFDALFEICNFVGNIKDISICEFDTNIYHLMDKKYNLTKKDFKKSLENPVARIGDKEVDLFTYTKNKNTYEAIKDFMKYFNQ